MAVRQGAYSAPAAACAAEVLHALRTSDGPVTLAQLERQLPRSKSLIFRVLRELEAREFVMRDHAGGFRLGIEAFEMATAYLGQWAFADVVRARDLRVLRQPPNPRKVKACEPRRTGVELRKKETEKQHADRVPTRRPTLPTGREPPGTSRGSS